MGKRSGLLKLAARPHAYGAAGGGTKPKVGGGVKLKKKKKMKVKLGKKEGAAAATPMAATAILAAIDQDDDMFAKALPTIAALRAKKEQGKRSKAKEAVDQVAAFEDAGTEDMFRRVLSGAMQQRPAALLPADEHRARMEELKRKSMEKRAAKAARWQSTRQRPGAMDSMS